METTSTIIIKKRRLTAEQRMSAKAFLLETFPELQRGGQLIIHFGPGRNAQFIESQEHIVQHSQIPVDNAA